MNTFKAVGFTLAALMAGYLGAFLERVAKGDSGVLDELNVRRLNIVEDNGNYALVIANSNNLPASNVNGGGNGAVRSGIPGMIFYNNLGDEIGGIIYPARDLESGYDGGVQLSMDQIKQTGQAIALRHWRSGDYVRSVLEITDYATDSLASEADDDPLVVHGDGGSESAALGGIDGDDSGLEVVGENFPPQGGLGSTTDDTDFIDRYNSANCLESGPCH